MDNKTILISCDNNGCDNKHVIQMISKSHQIAKDCGMRVSLLCADRHAAERAELLGSYGVDEIYLVNVQDNSFKAFCGVYEHAIKMIKPTAILFQATPFGKSIAATLSVRLGVGLTADCIEIECDNDGNFYFLRSAMADSLIAKIQTINSELAMCTVKENIFREEKCEYTKEADIKYIEYDYVCESNNEVRIHLDNHDKEIEVDIDKYELVFGIGRGVGDKNTCNRLIELAKKFNAGVVCTRAVVEDGWMEKAYQVGQSGKSIAPKTYIAFGISGACQHIVGIRNANHIISINTNIDAPINNYADCAMLVDVNQVIDELEKEIM